MSVGEDMKQVMKQCWGNFEDSLKNYLFSTEMTRTVQEMRTNLKFHLYVWKKEEESLAIGSVRTDKIASFVVNKFVAQEPDMPESDGKEIEGIPRDKFRQVILDMVRKECGEDLPVYLDTESVADIMYSGGTIHTFPGTYQAEWAATYEGRISEQIKLAISVFLKFIAERVDNLSLLEKVDEDMWSGDCKDLKYDFITWYENAVFSRCPIPEEKIVNMIAKEPYEGRDNRGIICFVSDECLDRILGDNTPGFVYFENEDCPEGGMEKPENLSNSRKMLELCGGGERYLLVSAEKPYYIRGVLSETYGEPYIKDKLTIRFMGRRNWRISKGEEVFLVFENGVYYADLSLVDEVLDEEMKKMSAVFEKNRDKKELFKRVFQRLQGQSHGALMIVAEDAQEEVQILCRRFKRGTQVREVECSRKENLELLDGMASVDGAILVDFEGICHGFGVILDGDAKVEGNLGRGSRYNSSRNYIAGTERYAVIVSEDKTKGIEILNGKELKKMERKLT